jgi:DNA-binding NarL/FixJ family response regulator
LKAFLVDYSKMIRDRLKKILASLGDMEVVGEAARPDEAAEAILRLRPDVVLLDIQLRGGNGYQVLQALRQSDFHPFILVLTNYPYPELRDKYSRAGANVFLDKSTEFHNVVPSLRTYAKSPGDQTGSKAV